MDRTVPQVLGAFQRLSGINGVTTHDPIERAAGALCKLDGHPSGATMRGWPLWHDYREEARAVLQAIGEPSETMLDAAHGNEHADWEAGWRAMIDAALEDA